MVRNQELIWQILKASRALWDRPKTPDAVRDSFLKIIIRRIFALGPEEKSVYHTCKARACTDAIATFERLEE